jgi:Anti-sigma factor NepR
MWKKMNQYANMSRGRLGDNSAANVGAGISAQLRHYYQSLQDEAVPDRLVSLLERLDAAERQLDANTSLNDRTRALGSLKGDAR